MAVRSSEYLKGKFEDGDRPSGADFADLVDSTLNYAITGLNSSGVDKLKVTSNGISIIGSTDISSGIDITGNASVSGTLTVAGNVISNNITNTDSTTTISNNLIVNGGQTVNGDHTVHGTLSAANFQVPILTLGESSSDTVTLNAQVSGSIIPETTDSFQIGSRTKQFTSGFFGGSLTSGIVTLDPVLDGDAELLENSRSFCIEELDINDNVTLNIFSGAELKVTPYSNF